MNTKKWILAETGTMIGDCLKDISDSRKSQGSVDGADGRSWSSSVRSLFEIVFPVFFCDFHQENPEFTVSRFNIGFSIFALPCWTDDVRELFDEPDGRRGHPGSPDDAR